MINKEIQEMIRNVSKYKEKYHTELEKYSRIIEAMTSKHAMSMKRLDQYWNEEYPTVVEERLPETFLTKKDIEVVIHWKLNRGTHRPFLIGMFRKRNEEAQVMRIRLY